MKVSCLMVTYNRAELLKEAIQSVINQTFKDWELIIVDGGSKDNTKEVVLGFDDKRIKYMLFHGDGYRKVDACRNEGLMEAKGEYTCFLDDDNKMKPDFMQALTAFLDWHKNIGVVYCDSEFFGECADEMPERSIDYDRKRMLNYNYIDIGEVMMRSHIFSDFGLFDPTLPGAGGDWEYWLRIGNEVKFQHLPVKLLEYRVHRGMLSRDKDHIEVLKILQMRISEGVYR